MGKARATYASICAKKLQKQKTYAQSLVFFIHTRPHYWKKTVIYLPIPTNDTQEIVYYTLSGLKEIFMLGYQYKKRVSSSSKLEKRLNRDYSILLTGGNEKTDTDCRQDKY